MASIPGYAGWGEAEAQEDYKKKHGGQAYGGGNALDTQFQGYADEINKYTEELISQAKGDYDYVAKWIEKNYQTAAGTDNAERAQFMKQVANNLESKVGRIEFDHQTGTYRANQAADTDTKRVTEDKTTALARLDEDEQVMRQQQGVQAEQERGATSADLNSRGLINDSYGKTSGLGGKVIGDVEQGITDRMGALERAVGRDRSDTILGADRSISDIGLNRKYTLEDLDTGARRGMIDEQNSYDQGLEGAARARDSAIQGFNAQRYGQQNQLKSLYTDKLAKTKLGY